ncbi:ANTAR domain-containing protein [Clostridium sp. SHJSY1]|uniref:ANTAR domain-containing response regulator n=1 Tax=Clostridium sp. SHJSY1 TaxID=2942483 RepID=UPI0028764AED|nr:ANTAR domain-containing protein [Clostridium sp. SHJSY1]MDS0526371.1 ANTAR domain-containing protein [Clostridium sp. SHJSY1]
MDKILLVCSSDKGTKVYTENLKSMGYVHIDTEGNSGSARRRLIHEDYSIIIVDTPLKDEFGSDFAVKLSRSGNSGIILVVKSENADLVSAKVEEYGIFVIPKPFTKSIFHQGVKFVFTSLKRFSVLRNEKNKLMKQVEDIKKIDRAKCLLIQYNNMTEEEAHKYLEKQAMDARLTRREVADKIINYLGV